MSVLSPFSLSIFCSSQPSLEDDRDSDPSSSSSDSPPLLPNLDFTVSRPQRRRWTLAMAMTDEGMTDEAFVETLERIRLERDPSGTDNSSAVWDLNRDTWNWEVALDEKKREARLPHTSSLPSFPLQHCLSVPSSPKLGITWQAERQALLTCRELVRTERHYLSSLKVLIASKTATIPPPLMIHYASQLTSVSERYLARLEEDPSVLGVATSFLGLEEAVESAFVGWCGVVGSWFEGSGSGALTAVSQAPSPKRKLSKGRSEGDIPTLAYPGNGGLRRTVSAWKRNVPTMTQMNASAASSSQGPAFLTPSFSSSFLGWRKDRPVLGPSTNGHQIKKPPAVRDLAILPTQRVLRYVLLYRDLLAHTPATSPSHGLVDRAVEAVTRIAQKCDRAQDNSAFLVKPSKISSVRSRKASTG